MKLNLFLKNKNKKYIQANSIAVIGKAIIEAKGDIIKLVSISCFIVKDIKNVFNNIIKNETNSIIM